MPLRRGHPHGRSRLALEHIDYIGSDGHGSAGIFRLASNGEPQPTFGSAEPAGWRSRSPAERSRSGSRATFAAGGLIRITRPGNVNINALVRSGRDRVVAAGVAGNALYVTRYRVD